MRTTTGKRQVRGRETGEGEENGRQETGQTGGGGGHTQRQRDISRNREREREGENHRQTERERNIDRETERVRETERQRYREAEKQRNRQREKGRETETQRTRETEKQRQKWHGETGKHVLQGHALVLYEKVGGGVAGNHICQHALKALNLLHVHFLHRFDLKQ